MMQRPSQIMDSSLASGVHAPILGSSGSKRLPHWPQRAAGIQRQLDGAHDPAPCVHSTGTGLPARAARATVLASADAGTDGVGARWGSGLSVCSCRRSGPGVRPSPLAAPASARTLRGVSGAPHVKAQGRRWGCEARGVGSAGITITLLLPYGTRCRRRPRTLANVVAYWTGTPLRRVLTEIQLKRRAELLLKGGCCGARVAKGAQCPGRSSH
jgi:hypothetical protein